MTTSQWRQAIVIINLAALTAGCTTVLSPEDFKAYLADPKAPRVAVQVCLTNRKAHFEEIRVDVTDMPEGIPFAELARMYKQARNEGKYDNPYRSASPSREHQTIRRWRQLTDNAYSSISIGEVANEASIVSDGGGHAYLADSTERDQAVYFSFTGKRPSDVIAVHVAVPVERGGKTEMRQFWFRLPPNIPRGAYTEWMTPASEEDRNNRAGNQPAFWLLTHGKEMPIYSVGENAPRLRYTLYSYEEYQPLDNEGRRAKNAAGLKDLLENPSERMRYVPVRHSSIPGC